MSVTALTHVGDQPGLLKSLKFCLFSVHTHSFPGIQTEKKMTPPLSLSLALSKSDVLDISSLAQWEFYGSTTPISDDKTLLLFELWKVCVCGWLSLTLLDNPLHTFQCTHTTQYLHPLHHTAHTEKRRHCHRRVRLTQQPNRLCKLFLPNPKQYVNHAFNAVHLELIHVLLALCKYETKAMDECFSNVQQ